MLTNKNKKREPNIIIRLSRIVFPKLLSQYKTLITTLFIGTERHHRQGIIVKQSYRKIIPVGIACIHWF